MGPKNLKKELDEILIVERAINRKQKLKKGSQKRCPILKSCDKKATAINKKEP